MVDVEFGPVDLMWLREGFWVLLLRIGSSSSEFEIDLLETGMLLLLFSLLNGGFSYELLELDELSLSVVKSVAQTPPRVL